MTGYGTTAQFGVDSMCDPVSGCIACIENEWQGVNNMTMHNDVTYQNFIAMHPTGTFGALYASTYAEWHLKGLYTTFSAIVGPTNPGVMCTVFLIV